LIQSGLKFWLEVPCIWPNGSSGLVNCPKALMFPSPWLALTGRT
jgi:hypothetical protein